MDGLVLTNTSIKLRENLVSDKKNEVGGLSGTPINETSNLIIKKFFKIIKNKIPIICGGTGMYIDALVDGVIYPQVLPDKKLTLYF